MAEVDSRVSLVHQEVTEQPGPVFDPTPSAPDVVRDEHTGKVTTVSLDRQVSADDPRAVQIPPEVDGTRHDVLGTLSEPTPEQAFAEASKPAAKADDSSKKS